MGTIVAVDTEGSGLHPDDGARVSTVSIAYRRPDDELVARYFCFDQGRVADKDGCEQGSLLDDPDQLDESKWRSLLQWLSRQQLVFHHARHDLLMLRYGTRGWRGLDLTEAFVWDTMLAERMLTPGEYGMSDLDTMGLRLFGMGKDKSLEQYLKSHRLKRYDLVPPEVIGPYAARDAELTLRAYESQQRRIYEGVVTPGLVDREMAICKVLIGMERRGLGIDVDGLAQAEKARSDREHELERQLPFDPTLNQAKRYFFGTAGVVPHCTNKSGPGLRECCVRQMVEHGIQHAKTWSELAKVRSAGDKWYRPWLARAGEDGRLRTQFGQTLEGTMRFSSTRVNLQALPHDYRIAEGLIPPRRLIVPAEGKLLFEMDLAGAELRVAAKVARCQRMLEALEAGEDLHAITAEVVFDRRKGDIDFFEYRQVSKRCNFGLIYSIGVKTFVADVEKHTGKRFSEEEGSTIIRRWRSLYPEFKRINRKAEARARGRGYIRLCTGRERWFMPGEELHKAFNARIQGDIAECTKEGLLLIDRDWPETILLTTHDSIMVEVADPEEPALMAKVWSERATKMVGVTMEVEVKSWVTAATEERVQAPRAKDYKNLSG